MVMAARAGSGQRKAEKVSGPRARRRPRVTEPGPEAASRAAQGSQPERTGGGRLCFFFFFFSKGFKKTSHSLCSLQPQVPGDAATPPSAPGERGPPSVFRGAHNATGGGGGGRASSRAEKPQAGGGGGRRAGAGHSSDTEATDNPASSGVGMGRKGAAGSPLETQSKATPAASWHRIFAFFLKERNPKAPTLLRWPEPPTIQSTGASPRDQPPAAPGAGPRWTSRHPAHLPGAASL